MATCAFHSRAPSMCTGRRFASATARIATSSSIDVIFPPAPLCVFSTHASVATGACGDAGETSVVRVLQGNLNVTKAVSPVAGGGTVIEFGDTLTYTLTVSATGELTQNNVVVTDFIPGYDPARPTSGKTTYVAGSAACSAGPRVPTRPPA